MQFKLRGFAWYAFPDPLGAETAAGTDPGHPFANGLGGIRAPEEIIYFKRINAADTGVNHEPQDHGYLVLSSSRHHPRLASGWESEPARLTEKFQTQDGKVKMLRVIQVHHRHAGDLVECELKVEHSEPAMAGEKRG